MSVSFLNFKAMQTCLVTTKVTGNRLVSTISYNCPPYHRIDCSASLTPINALFVRPSDFLPHRLVSLTSSCLLSLTRPMMNIRNLRCYLNHYIHGLSARRARRTKSRGPKGLQLEVGARRAPRLLVNNI